MFCCLRDKSRLSITDGLVPLCTGAITVPVILVAGCSICLVRPLFFAFLWGRYLIIRKCRYLELALYTGHHEEAAAVAGMLSLLPGRPAIEWFPGCFLHGLMLHGSVGCQSCNRLTIGGSFLAASCPDVFALLDLESGRSLLCLIDLLCPGSVSSAPG